MCVCDSRVRICVNTESIPAEKARFVNGNTKISLERSTRLYGSAAAGEGYTYIYTYSVEETAKKCVPIYYNRPTPIE